MLSKALKYAVDCELISKSPKIGLYKVERPEIEPWDFEQYARVLKAAKVEGPDWYAAVCLAGEAGLRVGEVKALRWITVNQQTCYGETTTPKGRTRRTIPMTAALERHCGLWKRSAKVLSCGTSMAARRRMARRTR